MTLLSNILRSFTLQVHSDLKMDGSFHSTTGVLLLSWLVQKQIIFMPVYACSMSKCYRLVGSFYVYTIPAERAQAIGAQASLGWVCHIDLKRPLLLFLATSTPSSIPFWALRPSGKCQAGTDCDLVQVWDNRWSVGHPSQWKSCGPKKPPRMT